jgi:hypothetical protein
MPKEIRRLHKRVTLSIDMFFSTVPHVLQLWVWKFVFCLWLTCQTGRYQPSLEP